MKTLKTYLDHTITWTIAIIALIVFALFIALVLPRVSAYTEDAIGGIGSPDTELLYSGEDLYKIAESYGEDGRSTYIFLRWTFDILWPLVYMFFILSFIIVIGKPLKAKWLHKVFWLPIAAMGFDYLENTLVTIVMVSFPKSLYTLGTIASYVSLAKWVVLSLAFVGIFIVWIARIVDKLMTKKDHLG